MKTKAQHLLTFQKRYFFWKKFFTTFFSFFVPVFIGYCIGELISGKILELLKTWPEAIVVSIGTTIVISFGITLQKSLDKEKDKIKEKIHDLQQDIFMLEEVLKDKKTTELEKESIANVKRLYRLKNRYAKKEAYLHMLGG